MFFIYSPTAVILSHNSIFCKLQQKLFGTSVLKCDGSFSILARALNTNNRTNAKPLMLNDITFFQTNVTNSHRLWSRRFMADWHQTWFGIGNKLRSNRTRILETRGWTRIIPRVTGITARVFRITAGVLSVTLLHASITETILGTGQNTMFLSTCYGNI